MSKNINNMSFLQKIIAVVVSIVLIASLLGSGTYFLINHINNSRALSGTISSIGNMLRDSNTVEYSTYQKLLTALGNDTTSTRNKSAINGGTPVVFQMGTVNNKAINWQVVYQKGDIITVWMTDCYTNEYFNKSGSAVKNSALAGYTSGQYDNYSNYSKSVIRDVTKGIYNTLNTSNPVISKVVKSPSEAGATWQKTQKEDIYVNRNSSSGTSNSYIDSYYYYAHHNGLDSYGGKYTGWAQNLWDTSNTPYNDKFWIPSYYEVYNTTNHATSTSGYITSQDSLWGLTATDRGFAGTTLDGSSVSSCWLRSGYSSVNYGALQVNSSGVANSRTVYYIYGVRPAAHISLTELYNAAPKISSVTLDQQNGTGGSTTVTATNGSAMPTITPPTKTGYTFGGYWTGINGTGTQYYTNTVVSARNWDKSGDVTLYAYWIIDKFNITLNSNNTNYGTILNSGGSIDYGTTYTSYAIAQQNCAFLYWLDSSNPNAPIYQNPLTITVTENKTYTAYFTNSLIDGVVCVATVGGEARIVGYDAGDTEVTFIAVAYLGYKFDGWFVKNGSTALSTDLSCRLPMSTIDGKIVVARFSKIANNINDSTDTPDSGFV